MDTAEMPTWSEHLPFKTTHLTGFRKHVFCMHDDDDAPAAARRAAKEFARLVARS